MKKMNKVLTIVLALTMMLALAACGGNSGNNGGENNGAQANDNPYNLDYTSADLQPMSDERADKDTLLEAKEYYIDGLAKSSADFTKLTYKDVAEHIGVDASEFQYFESYKQYRYTWYIEGNEGSCLLVAFDANGNLYAVTASIS